MNLRQVVGLDDYTEEELIAAVEEGREAIRCGKVVSAKEAYADFLRKRGSNVELRGKALRAR